MIQVRPLVEEYFAKVEIDHKILNEQIAVVNARVSAESTLIFRIGARSEQL